VIIQCEELKSLTCRGLRKGAKRTRWRIGLSYPQPNLTPQRPRERTLIRSDLRPSSSVSKDIPHGLKSEMGQSRSFGDVGSMSGLPRWIQLVSATPSNLAG